jgi:hypothetical protein
MSCAYTPAILVKVLIEHNVVKPFNSKVKTWPKNDLMLTSKLPPRTFKYVYT